MVQLELIPTVPKLSERQQEAVQHLQHAGPDGITAAELGHLLYPRTDDAKSWALSVLRALKKKGLVRQTRGGVWRHVDADPAADTSLLPGQTDEIPY